ncbi:protein tyrosine phosphatase domain-containing protein 1-like [Oncorhynchus tshawytscha]|uniref:Protein tyrosine phosphatase domain-containing protein 1 n=1 Tax=Oncorhynchus tshawytscha TaxID=74940 RepID=A0A8C8H761_ONCTS|nr:protein tyrosine phosphatase domain-containing protein 1-like [Oncorhynchus tshawytscha]
MSAWVFRHLVLHPQTSSGVPYRYMESVRTPRANYTLVGEVIRHVIPGATQCSIGCGGLNCKYEDPDRWSEDKQAIKGLYSSWVTENLLAMARPSTALIEKYNIIDQFKRCGLKTVINLQRPGEHASCGPNTLEPESGFSYRPEVFMENDIYFYNFGWNDYGVASLTSILDMVKVMSFAMQEGKMSVHCHAGLGRTGVLLACYLVFATRMTADQAIVFVRSKRPNSIQTRGQLYCVREFAQFLVPIRSIFSCAEPSTNPVTLSQFLTRQRHMLHGYERRELRHLPKIIHVICKLLLDIAEHRQVIEEDMLDVNDMTAEEEVEFERYYDFGFTKGSFGGGSMGDRPRLPGPPTKHRHANEPALFYHRKSLSYSESDVQRLGSELHLLTQPLSNFLSTSNLPVACSSSLTSLHRTLATVSPVTTTYSSQNGFFPHGSLWEQKSLAEGSPLLKKRQKACQSSESECHPKQKTFGSMLFRWREKLANNGNVSKVFQIEESEVPFITIQTELSKEARRVLVAQALAVDLELDGEDEHLERLHAWQSGLNMGGAWERLCTLEKDPFVLSGLMWTWLEQLKEPVISVRDVQKLDLNDSDPANPEAVFKPLDQAPREMLMCILDCMAHVLTIPEEVEAAFLDRTIKAFTKMGKCSAVYPAMTEILRLVLHDMRFIAIEEDEVPFMPPGPIMLTP